MSYVYVTEISIYKPLETIFHLVLSATSRYFSLSRYWQPGLGHRYTE